ncbi:MAG: hypothetical protein ACRDGV_12320 [Candidatus Limnocylindria bacterium]
MAAAIEVQRAHVRASWPRGLEVRVRLGLHTGEPAVGDEGYTGMDVVRAARIAAVGSGGQVLLSDTTRAIAAGDLPDGVTLRSLGERQLKDIDRPEPLWALVIDEVQASAAAAPEPDAAEPEVTEPKAGEPEAAESAPAPASPLQHLITRARQRIESRVLAELEESLPGNWSSHPPGPRKRPVTREIARLHELHEEGALTDEQYRRAVDRLLEAEEEPSSG